MTSYGVTPVERRILVIEYLRGLAALAVTWFHLTNTFSPGWVRTSGSYGWLGVEVFFVISGFIIPYSIKLLFNSYSIANFPSFVGRRALRLEPPYLVSVVLTVALWNLSAKIPGFGGQAPPSDVWQGAAHVAYFIPLTSYQWYQPVYWTLAYEFAFYILIGLSFPWICRPDAQLMWCVVTLAICSLVVSELLPERTPLFIIGIAVYRADLAGSHEKLRSLMAIVLATIAIAAREPLVAGVGASTAAVLFARRYVGLGGVPGKLLLGLGAMSYSLYLTHVPIGGRIVNLSRRYIDGTGFEILLSLGALGVSLTFAFVFMKLIERPAVELARRYAAHCG